MSNFQSDLWQPSASIEVLKARAELFALIRNFFKARNVLEVETPLLSKAAVTDPFIDSISANYHACLCVEPEALYLQTSPEYAMKRLLAAGSGCIYSLNKAFRNSESGRLHNPEFTMLEWYRLDFDEQQLMTEIEGLMQAVLNLTNIERISYRDLFLQHLQIDPHQVSADELKQLLHQHLDTQGADETKDSWLNLLMTEILEPELAKLPAVFVYDYPASQAGLACLKQNDQAQQVAARFELFIKGIELANGYHELSNAEEQAARFKQDQLQRKHLNLPAYPADTRLVNALAAGFPDCAGVALGVDRLLMLLLGKEHIEQVLSFPLDRA